MTAASAPTTRHVALLRGINVGTAARISMADLRAVFEELGYTNVRTILQSGNVVFDSTEKTLATSAASTVQQAIATKTGVDPVVTIVDAARFRGIVEANPLADIATDPSRGGITFMNEKPSDTVDRPSDEELLPERIVFGEHAIYQWLPDGILATKLSPKYFRQQAAGATFRNLRTVARIVAVLDAD